MDGMGSLAGMGSSQGWSSSGGSVVGGGQYSFTYILTCVCGLAFASEKMAGFFALKPELFEKQILSSELQKSAKSVSFG